MKIGITGANGFIGGYLKLLFSSDNRLNLVEFDREFFEHSPLMDAFVSDCDVIIHTASVIRHDNDDYIYNENVKITKSLLSSIAKVKPGVKLIFLSTIQRDADSAYGKSKKYSEEILTDFADKNNGNLLILQLPGIFGENQKPHFNSVVATFCNEILDNLESKISAEASVELLHVRHVVNSCLEYIFKLDNQAVEVVRLKGSIIKVVDLYNTLYSFRSYKETQGVIPSVNGIFEIDLFNTFLYLSSVKNGPAVFDIATHEDERGNLSEIIKTKIKGQVFYSLSKKGVIRGNHYHTRKIERFCVVSGEALITIKNELTNKLYEIQVTGENPKAVDMPTCCVHSLKNTGNNELLSIFWTNEFFDPADPDTYYLNK